MDITADTSSTQLPSWLAPLSSHDQKFPRSPDHLAIQRITYESIFERALEEVEAGGTIFALIKNDPRGIDYGKFMKWMNLDPERKKRFREAKTNGALAMEDRLLEVAAGKDGLEDVNRSKLIVDTMWKMMQVNDRDRYSTSVKHEHTVGVDIKKLLEDRAKAIEGDYRVIDADE